jgi:hypothetical protein
MIGSPGWLGSGGARYAVPDLNCPPGMRPTLVSECALSIPIYECVWLSGSVADCYVKRWECAAYQLVWECETAFRVVQT